MSVDEYAQTINSGITKIAGTGLTAIATDMTVDDLTGLGLDSLTAPQFALVKITQIAQWRADPLQSPETFEIVKITADNGSENVDITRGQEGTSGTAFGIGDPVELVWTSGEFQHLVDTLTDGLKDINIKGLVATGTITAGSGPHVITTAAGLLAHAKIDPAIAGSGLSVSSGVLSVDSHVPAAHTIAFHDTTATGGQLDALVGNIIVDTLHRHSELSASDGDPDAALTLDAAGQVGLGASTIDSLLHMEDSGTNSVPVFSIENDTVKWELLVDGASFDQFRIRRSGGDHLTITTSGDVILSDDLTLSTGDFISTAGNVTLSEGVLNITSTAITAAAIITRNIDSAAGSGVLQVIQDHTGGEIAPLYLQQDDVNKPMIRLETTIGTGNTIEAVASKTLTTTHFVQVLIPGGLTRYFPVGTIA